MALSSMVTQESDPHASATSIERIRPMGESEKNVCPDCGQALIGKPAMCPEHGAPRNSFQEAIKLCEGIDYEAVAESLGKRLEPTVDGPIDFESDYDPPVLDKRAAAELAGMDVEQELVKRLSEDFAAFVNEQELGLDKVEEKDLPPCPVCGFKYPTLSNGRMIQCGGAGCPLYMGSQLTPKAWFALAALRRRLDEDEEDRDQRMRANLLSEFGRLPKVTITGMTPSRDGDYVKAMRVYLMLMRDEQKERG